MRICGLTPKEHIHLYGSLAPDVQERLVYEHSDLQRLLSFALQAEGDIEQLAYQNHDCADTRAIADFLRCVRTLYGYV